MGPIDVGESRFFLDIEGEIDYGYQEKGKEVGKENCEDRKKDTARGKAETSEEKADWQARGKKTVT